MNRTLALVALPVLAVAALAGCDRPRTASLVGLPNQPPTITLDRGAAGLAGGGTSAYLLTWTARDPDGRVDHFETSDDLEVLRGRDANWRRQDDAAARLSLRSRKALPSPEAAASELSIFAVRAVDDRGAVSVPAIRGFFADNIAPSVQITSPYPSALVNLYVPTSLHIQWQGSDPDGSSGLPVKYKYRLFREGFSEPPFSAILTDPDTLRRYYAPTFQDWDSTSAESTSVQFTNLPSGQNYIFAVVAIDEQGDYSPLFNFNTNLLRFRVTLGNLGPILTVRSALFNYQTASGGFQDDPATAPVFEYPRALAFGVSWSAVPNPGSLLTGYRWALDPASVPGTLTRRTLDVAHGEWSNWSILNTSATIGPFRGAAATAEHRLYIEVMDNVGFSSRLLIRLRPVQSTFAKDLLVVDDTRLPVTTGDIGLWPNAAELDTFLYARGGFQWKGKPAGTVSRPGLLEGYSYDTLGTRTGQSDLTVPLATLSQYRNVLWLTSQASVTNTGAGTIATTPMSAMRYMSGPGRANSLAAYVAAGGRVWLVGLPATANLIPYDRTVNNSPVQTFDSAVMPPELFPGQLTFDGSRWRSQVRVQLSSPSVPVLAPGLASHAPPPQFPGTVELRSSGTDSVPPGRSAAKFYPTSSNYEYLSAPNEIHENALPPYGDAQESVLDTLYRIPISGGQPFPCMTVYWGREGGSVVHTGFDLWSWRRTDCVGFVDGVLNGLWGLQRVPGAAATVAVEAREKNP